MGVINHNAVIATTWDEKIFNEVVKYLQEAEIENFSISEEVVNGYRSIVLFPDGSKEGWQESDDWDSLRTNFMDKLDSYAYKDGPSPWSYVEVGFGEYGQKVLRGNNVNCYNDKEYAEQTKGGGDE